MNYVFFFFISVTDEMSNWFVRFTKQAPKKKNIYIYDNKFNLKPKTHSIFFYLNPQLNFNYR